MDALLDMLCAMRFTGGVFLDAEFAAPWCVTARIGPEDCIPFATEPRHIIAYHYVSTGCLLLKVGHHPSVTVQSGEMVVLPRNDDHIMGSALNFKAIRAQDLVHSSATDGLAKIVQGGSGERTRLLCGFLSSDVPHNAAIALLPSLLKIKITEKRSASWIESSFRCAAHEFAAGNAASAPVLAKLTEFLFIDAAQRHITSLTYAGSIWASGIRDPIVGRALRLLHAQIARRWTTQELAREIALSRSAFAERFTRVIGEPPMRYLARQRLEHASTRLKYSTDAITRIAFEVGYESAAAFNRAFKRAYGAPPASWRRDHLADKI